MPNLRIIHDNAADRATVTASSTAGTLAAENMLTDIKGDFHRSGDTSVIYTLSWSDFETVAGIALPACNLTPDATIRVRGYDAATGGALVADSGEKFACPGPPLGLWDWAMPLNSNAFAYGGAAKTAAWFDDHYAVKRIEIELNDPDNAAGYIDCARIVAGAYWSPAYNPLYGATTGLEDNSKNSRNDAGDLITDRGAINDAMRFDLAYMPPADRARMNQIMRGSGTARPVFISLMPDSTDALLEQDSMIYGKRQNAPMAFANYKTYSTNITIEGW